MAREKKESTLAKNEYILEYLKANKNQGLDTTDKFFHETFTKKFGGTRREGGANPNQAACYRMRDLYKQGVLRREIVVTPGVKSVRYRYYLS